MMREIEGAVRSGLGEGSRFTALPWATAAFERALGFVPSPGTLNLAISDARWPALRAEMARAPGIAIAPPPGFCGAKCFPVVLRGSVDGAVVVPDVEDYPPDKLEIIAAVPLRRRLRLNDGDTVRAWITL